MATIQEFNIDFKGNTRPLQDSMKKIQPAINNVASQFMKLGGVIAGAFAIGGGLKAVADLGSELANFEAQTGIAAEEVSYLGHALNEFGGNTQDAKADLDNLQKAFQDSLQGQGALINATKKYNIQVSNQGGKLQNIEQTYRELQKSVEKYDKATQNQILKEMGLTDASIRLIQNKKDLESTFTTTNNKVITQDEIQAGKEFNVMLGEIKQMIQKIIAVGLKSLMPVFRKVFSVITAVFHILTRNGGKFLKIIGLIVIALIAVKLVTIGISLAAQGVLWPFTLIAAIVLIVLVIVDDVWTFFEGGESILGDIIDVFTEWLDEFPLLKAYLQMVCDFWSEIWEWIKKAFDYICNFTWDGFIEDLKNVGSKIYNIIKDAICNAVSSGWNAFKSFFGFGGKAEKAVNEREAQQQTTINQTNNITTNSPAVATKAQQNANSSIKSAVQGGK